MVFAKKSLGQNFLISEKVREQIIEAGEISTDDTVLEIGPGRGFLTERLVEKAGKVIAVEKDDVLAPELQKLFPESDIIHGDIRDLTDEKLPVNYKLIANIPYYITGEIIRTFLEREKQPERLVLMVQREVADRIIARDPKPNGRTGGKESILSISVKAYGIPRLVAHVARGCFRPAPNVDSAVIAIENVSKEFFTDFSEEFFFTILRAGFSQKRKKLSNNLKQLFSSEQIEITLNKINADTNVRAEDLTLEEWGKLTATFQQLG